MWFEQLERRLLLSAVLDADSAVFQFHDADADQVTVRLRGSGAATITLDGDAADGADIDSIVLDGADAAMRLDVRVRRNAGDGATTIGRITGDTARSLRLRNVVIDGEGINLAGSLERLQAQALINGADVIIGAAAARGLRTDLVMVEGVEADPVRIATPGPVDRMRVTAGVRHLALDFGDDVDRIDLRGDVQAVRARIAGALNRFNVRRGRGAGEGHATDVRVSVGARNKRVRIDGHLHGGSALAAAGGFERVYVRGDVEDALILGGAQLDDQWGLSNAVFGVADVDRVDVRGRVVDAVIAAGGDPGADGRFALGDTLPGGRIGSVRVRGAVAGYDSLHDNPGIYAAQIDRVRTGELIGVAVIGNQTAPTNQVIAAVETDPTPSGSDSADDPAIWIHPDDASLSVILGTDRIGGGIGVYDLAGNELQFIHTGRLNNVDLRYHFLLGGEQVDLVVASTYKKRALAVFRIDPDTRQLVDVAADGLKVGIGGYGLAMYHDRAANRFYAFVSSRGGRVEQWELLDDGNGRVTGTLVRRFNVGGEAEGLVVDDFTGRLYVAQEQRGIWRYGADPGAGDQRLLVDSVRDGNLTADVEGLAIYFRNDGTGYLIASRQGDDDFAVYRREDDNTFLGTFRIVEGPEADGVTHTDGVEVTNVNLGPAFPMGMLVVQDDRNPGANKNYKVVPWDQVAKTFDPDLAADTSFDPRAAV